MTLAQNATIYQDEYVVMVFTIWSDALKTQRKSLQNASATYRVGLKGTPDTTVLEVTGTPNANGSVVVITDPANGIIQVNLRQGDTAVLAASRYDHQLLVTDSSGRINVVTDGYLTVRDTLP